MIRKKWLGQRASAVSVAVVFLFTCALFAGKLHAQTAQSTPSSIAGSVIKPAAPAAFLVAPSVSLGYSPTSVATGTLTTSGKLDLVTADYKSGNITVFTSLGKGSFAPGVKYASGAQPSSVTIVDIDGDGRADIILANESEGVISVFAGNGDGTLAARKTYAVGFAPTFVAAGDFSGSGKLDVAVAGASGKTLAIFQNDGTGNLKRPVNYALSGTPTALATADFNHDGHLDLAVATANGTVSVLLGKGNGQFSALPDISVAGGAISSIAVGDFNRDGNDDVAVTLAAQNQVAVMLGQGDGKFSPAASFAVGNSPVSTHVADVDGDGIPDLIVVNKGNNTFSVLSGGGDGSFKSALHFVVGNSPLGAVAGDYYGNGHVDVATIDQVSQTLSMPVAAGDGTFQTGRAYMAGVQPVAVASGDLTGSGKSDLVVANYCAFDATCGGSGSAAVLLAGAGGAYQLASTYAMGAGSVSIALLDVNGDKKLDLVALNRVDKTLSVRLGAGDGTFGKLNTIPLSEAPLAVAAGDFNKDGSADLAVVGDCGSATCTQPGQLEVLLGSGDGNFHSASTFMVGYSPVALAVGATFTGGNADILVANRCGQDASCKSGGTASLLLGDGVGAFKPGKDIALGSGPSSIALANLRGTGVLDLVVSRSSDNAIAVLPGTGKGSFQAAVPYSVGNAPGPLVIADFNGDGKPDLAVANTADATVSVLFGRGDGTLQTAFALPVAGNPAGLAAIGPSPSGRASLAAANGSATSPSAGSNITVVANLQQPKPFLATGPAPAISLTWTAGSSSPSDVNQSVSFTATVTGTAGNGAPTGGAVEFFSDGAPISDCGGTTGMVVTPGTSPSLVSTAVCATSVLTASTAGHAITAQYMGANDAVYKDSAVSTPAVTQVVKALNPSLGLGSTPGLTTALNTSVTFSAGLSGVAFTPLPPNGTISFTANNVAIANCSLKPLTGLSATCMTSDLNVGTNVAINATYQGDNNFIVLSPTSTNHSVTALSPTFAITANPTGSVTAGSTVTFTAALTGVTFTPVAPAGTISFTLNKVPIANCSNLTLVAPEQAACMTSGLVAPTDLIEATYSPDSNYTVTNPASFTETVTKAVPTVQFLSAPPTSTHVNQVVTYTAEVRSPASGTPTVIPSGNITFALNGATICGNPVGLSTSYPPQATCNYVPDHQITTATPVTATYSSDSNFTAGNTLSTTLTVATTNVQVNLLSSGTVGIAQPVTFSTTLKPDFTATGGVFPQGTVTFTTNATNAPTGSCLVAGGIKVVNGTVTDCTLTFPSAGTYNVTATFTTSDTNFATNSSTPLPQTITSQSQALGLSPSILAPAVNQPLSFTANFTSPITGTTVPVGNVTYTLDAGSATPTPLCSVVITGTGTIPPCAYTFATAGSHTITASFPGDTNFSKASVLINMTVLADPTATVITANPSFTSAVNQPVTFTATITPTYPGSQPITGNVTFTVSNGAPCTSQTVSSNTGAMEIATATCMVTFATAGKFTVDATYNTDNNFKASSAPQATQTVTAPGSQVVVSSLAAPFTVNLPATFQALITPASTGKTPPTGNVTFIDSDTATILCAPALLKANADGSATAMCPITFLNAGNAHTITAQYPGDGNFAFATGNMAGIAVGPAMTSLVVTSSLTPSFANQTVQFKAVVSPAPMGPALQSPKGGVIFTSDDTTGLVAAACPSAKPLARQSDGSSVATCTVTFPHLASPPGTINVTATFPSGADPNFLPSPNSTPQIVRDFNTAKSIILGSSSVSTTSAVFVTQGSTTSSDPFGPATIGINIAPSAGYTTAMTVKCAVYAGNAIPDQNSIALTDPFCTPAAPQSVSVMGGTTTLEPFVINASASAAVGVYTVQLSAVDPAILNNQQALNFLLYVVPTSAQLSLGTGATGTETVTFNTAANPAGIQPTQIVGSTSLACPTIWQTTTGTTPVLLQNTNDKYLQCSVTAASVSNTSTGTPVTINTAGKQTAQLERSSTIVYAVSLFGMPILAIIGFIGSKKSSRKNLFRFFLTLLILLGFSYGTGCGGSFNPPKVPTTTGIPAGTYLVQIVATVNYSDGTTGKVYAVVPLSVVTSAN